MPRAELFRHQAADEVHLIIAAHGDDKIRLTHARLQKDAYARAVSFDPHHVERALGPADGIGIRVDNDKLMILDDHLAGDGRADLSGPYDDNTHILQPLILFR